VSAWQPRLVKTGANSQDGFRGARSRSKRSGVVNIEPCESNEDRRVEVGYAMPGPNAAVGAGSSCVEHRGAGVQPRVPLPLHRRVLSDFDRAVTSQSILTLTDRWKRWQRTQFGRLGSQAMPWARWPHRFQRFDACGITIGTRGRLKTVSWKGVCFAGSCEEVTRDLPSAFAAGSSISWRAGVCGGGCRCRTVGRRGGFVGGL
jgi:hypothetical protein